MPFLLENTRRIVLKLGTGILTSSIGKLDTDRLAGLCREVSALRDRGKEVIIVSSGAIGLGLGRLGLDRRPSDLTGLQMCAAVGQAVLMETWQAGFRPYGRIVAQLLFTWEDLSSRARHVAAKDLINRLLAEGIIPIVNENDSISAAEIKFGDNDNLSALVASFSRADQLVILSRAPGLIDRTGTGRIVPFVEEITSAHRAMAGDTDDPTGRGGMITKLAAAALATRNGCGVFIGSGRDPAILSELFTGEPEGTYFLPARLPLSSRKRWIAFFETPRGLLTVDEGARRSLVERGSSLLARGLLRTEGIFPAGAVVALQDPAGNVFARGITNYAQMDLVTLRGLSTPEVKARFPAQKHHEVIRRDHLVLL